MGLDNEVKILYPKSPPQRWIEIMKFSPCGKFLAIGTHRQELEIISTKSWKRIDKGKGHSSAVNCIDWDVNSEWLRTVDQAHELLFWNCNPKTGKIDRNPSGASGTTGTIWSDHTAKFSWNV